MQFLEIYLDKYFVDQFMAKSGTYTHEYFNDFRNFWLLLRNCKIYTNYSEEEWCDELKKDNVFIKNVTTSGKIPGMHYDCDFVSEWESFIDSQDRSPFKLFFLEHVLSIEINKFGYENIQTAEFDKKWYLFFSGREDRELKLTEKEIDNSFKSWSALNQFSHPVNSIIINDQHILLDEINQRIEDNLFPLLKQLLSQASQTIPVHITLFSNPEHKRPDRIKPIHQKITSFLNQFLGVDRYNLNIIKNGHHDRFIITNYFYIKSSNTFNYFREGGTIKSSRDIYFSFLFHSVKSSHCFDALQELCEVCQKSQISEPDASYEVLNHYPNKVNRFLN